ncbi:MAG TPA: DUF1800 domain-containing protein [Bryobacteraceae bacterium]|nr:DUF1800 domain-containing protein [Bryobacteraceae bacterium]
MSKRFLTLAAVCGLIGATGVAALAAKAARKQADETRLFLQQIPRDQRILQALNRLTFGARPGDVAAVRAMGLKKWIDLQLHPARIPENPVLADKLKYLDSLNMASDQLVRNYPAPQIVRQMVAGQLPFPSDPERQAMIRKLVARAEAKQGVDAANAGSANAAVPQRQPLAEILNVDQIRTLRRGTPQQRVAFFETLPRKTQDEAIADMPGQMRQSMFPFASPDLRRRIELTNGPAQVVARDLSEAKILRAVYSNRQLEEVLTDFWYNHFNIYLDKGADRYLVTEYERDTIRPHVLGKFRDLLEATAKSPAMLFYLDNWQSVGPHAPRPRNPNAKQARRGLNENYGRELVELHTLGVDSGYTQKDVTEVARCFTGWTINQPQRGGQFVFNPRLHDNGAKVVLGVTIPAGGGESDGEKVLDILAHHPATAHFISRLLAERFVADDPPPTLVDRMAQTFLKSDGDIREVLGTMLASREFWSAGAYRSKMKSPLEMVASAVRAVDGNVDFAFPLVNQVAQLGEPLYRKQEPTGYSNSSEEWVNTAGLLARMNFALQLANNKVPGVKVDTALAAKPGDLAGITLGSPEFQKH